MQFHVITLSPEMFDSPFRSGVIGRAIRQGIIQLLVRPLREHGLGAYRQVDDEPYGGGSGMVMRPEPLTGAIEQATGEMPGLWRVLMTPQGKVLNHDLVKQLAERRPGLLLIAGRYEGIDERVRTMVDEEISIGDYVLSGGELPAMVLIESVARIIPGVLGNSGSLDEESFSGEGLLEYPQYTRPEEFRGMKVPEILLSGDHEKIRQWRQQQSRERTRKRRPELLSRLDQQDKQKP